MKDFACICGTTVYFENSRCLVCERNLGFVPEALEMCAFGDGDAPTYNGHPLKPCRNWTEHDTCNWLVPEGTGRNYCASCTLNEMIPDLRKPRRLELWFDVEQAKRRLIYTLLALGLPIVGKNSDPAGLSFRILADERLDKDDINAPAADHVSTGHYRGQITLNLLEADARMREEMREAMNESYRTVLGHMRHESGHFYFDQLVTETEAVRFRQYFDDDRAPYGDSLSHYYRDGPPNDWQSRYLSAYASAHPFEDFAETWAHYLHMIDTLETAHSSHLQIGGDAVTSPLSEPPETFDEVLADWISLTVALNRLNRSMGLADAYPFALTPLVVGKLSYVHNLIQRASQSNRGRLDTPWRNV